MPESQTSDRVVAGRYRLLVPLGQGGMGTVWRAVDEVLQREVAVKELRVPPELTPQERATFMTRTFREARAAGRLSHPGVAAVYDVFEESGHPWIVLQLVPSQTLGQVIADRGPLPPREVAAIGAQILAALSAAHAAGVLHRDVKPENVLMAEDGRAVLTDFGIATLENDSSITLTGALIGTPAYISPERAAGHQAERASDLWALGVTLYTATEARSPFHRGTPLASLAAIMYEEPAHPENAGPLSPIIQGLLRKNPGDRMTAAEAAPALHQIATGTPTMPLTPVPPSPVSGPSTVVAGAAPAVGPTAGPPTGMAGPTAGMAGPIPVTGMTPGGLPPSPTVVAAAPRRRWPMAAAGITTLAAGAALVAYLTTAGTDPTNTTPVTTPTSSSATKAPKTKAPAVQNDEPVSVKTDRPKQDSSSESKPSPKPSPSEEASKKPTQEPSQEPNEDGAEEDADQNDPGDGEVEPNGVVGETVEDVSGRVNGVL